MIASLTNICQHAKFKYQRFPPNHNLLISQGTRISNITSMEKTSTSTHGGTTSTSSEEGSTLCMGDIELNMKDTESASKEQPHESTDSQRRTCCQTLCKIYRDYDFLVLLLATVPLAKAYPPLGAVYLQPDITADWIAVMYIFRKY